MVIAVSNKQIRSLPLAVLCALLLGTTARALPLPEELETALPEGLLAASESEGPINGGLHWLLDSAGETAGRVLREGTRNAALLVLTAVLCGAAESVTAGAGGPAPRFVPWCAVLAAVTLSAGDLRALIGLGARTVDELGTLSKLLLPALAAAMAAGGCVSSAGMLQAGTLLACDLLSDAVSRFLLPLVYCYIALAAAGTLLENDRLDSAAETLRKLTAWGLKAVTGAFTGYLTLSGALTGSADKAAVKAAKAALSGAIPVVGGVLSDAAEGVLAAAGTARVTLGALGVFAILALCLTPMLRLGTQYLFYKAAAFAAGLAGTEKLSDLLDRMGEAFALVLGMTAACAAVLLAALLVAAVMVTA